MKIKEQKLSDDDIFKSFINLNIIKTDNAKDKILRGDLYQVFHKLHPHIKKPFFMTKMKENNKVYVIGGSYYYKYIKLLTE